TQSAACSSLLFSPFVAVLGALGGALDNSDRARFSAYVCSVRTRNHTYKWLVNEAGTEKMKVDEKFGGCNSWNASAIRAANTTSRFSGDFQFPSLFAWNASI
uniref:Ovule protein n=1 Tax=Parascaris univalens TaxID=6257 RepID=A0A915AS98_PARUN